MNIQICLPVMVEEGGVNWATMYFARPSGSGGSYPQRQKKSYKVVEYYPF